MYTINNTDLEVIIRNSEVRNVKNKDNNCVLISTGSLNPVHRSHLKNLSLVKDFLEKHKTRPLNVLAAYLSPSHDSYVRSKLGEKHWIPGEERIRLCKDAIKHENLDSFISVTEGELAARCFVDFDEVTIRLAEFLNYELCESKQILSDPLKVVYVCGLDHFNKCPYVKQLVHRENIACAVVYRLGASDTHIKRLEEKSSSIYYITLDDERETLIDISSTEIRKRYQNINDQTDSDQIAYPSIGEYLKNKYHKT